MIISRWITNAFNKIFVSDRLIIRSLSKDWNLTVISHCSFVGLLMTEMEVFNPAVLVKSLSPQ